MSDHEPMLTAETSTRDAAPHPTAETSLLLDIGSAWTKASVVGRTRGRWRIVAHAAQPTKWGEAALLEVLTERMREAVDRRLHDRCRPSSSPRPASPATRPRGPDGWASRR